DLVLAELEGKGLFCRQVKVDVASHSSQMDPLKADLFEALKDIQPQPIQYPVYSTVLSKTMEGTDMDAGYWVNNLRGTVQFAAVMQQLLDDGHTVLIEASPHPVLVNAVQECMEHAKVPAITSASLFREKPEQESIYKNMRELYTRGYNFNWKVYYSVDVASYFVLPS